MEGFGVHTFRMINAKGKSHFVKFHWKPKLGMQSVIWNEAVKINGADADFHRRDLWNSIQSGDFPEWELGLQILDDKMAAKFPFDVLDPTKLIPEEDVPVQIVGKLVLNRCVDNFFAETEQVAFCTQNIVPGIDFSNYPLLQGRNFSYLDTQIKRLGSPNFTHIPVNAPKCPMHLFQQDGHMAMKNPTGRANYEPNSWGVDGGPRENPVSGFHSFPEKLEGEKIRARSETFADHYSQARQFYISQTAIEQHHMTEALIFELSKVEKLQIRERMVAHLLNIDKTFAEKVAEGLRLKSLPQAMTPAKPVNRNLKKSPALSIALNSPKTFEGRKLGIFLTDGADAKIFKAVKKAITAANATYEMIAPQVGGVKLDDGSWVNANQNIKGAPSVLYDAVMIMFSLKTDKKLFHEPAVRGFVDDAFSHFKFIGYVDSVKPLFTKLGLSSELDAGCINIKKTEDVKTFMTALKKLRFWSREERMMS